MRPPTGALGGPGMTNARAALSKLAADRGPLVLQALSLSLWACLGGCAKSPAMDDPGGTGGSDEGPAAGGGHAAGGRGGKGDAGAGGTSGGGGAGQTGSGGVERAGGTGGGGEGGGEPDA